MNQSPSHTDKWKQILDASLEKDPTDSLSAEEQSMMQEALEGLRSLDNDDELNKSVAAINKNLHIQIKKRKKNNHTRRTPMYQGKVWLVTIIVLALICVAFLFILKIK